VSQRSTETTTVGGAIDIHAHIAPLSFLQEVKRSARSFGVEVDESADGYAITFPGISRLRPAGGGLTDTQDRVRWMDSNGIGFQYLADWRLCP